MQNYLVNQRMPLLIPAAGFDAKLNMSERNVEHTEAFMRAGVRDFALPGFVTPHGYRLLQCLKGDQYRLVTDNEYSETVYAVKLAFLEHIVPTKKICTQIMVWKTVQPQHDAAVSGLPQEFFRHFLSRYSIVVSDSEQTSDGRRFWERMIAWAIQADGYHVYVSDGTEEDRPLTFMTSWDDFYGTWASFCWGKDRDCHSHRLFVISTESLH
ncbi:hypothetical protein [Mixta sp. Marseille-Q2659]|uniref:hypothetical protein n=1 Tax=Mixta sp. Marseille-Q2659 TaxID=2736607 RepID=UPI0023BA12E4|nr:hypothetical protein [Mixta sp. Marseille-Q2659]